MSACISNVFMCIYVDMESFMILINLITLQVRCRAAEAGPGERSNRCVRGSCPCLAFALGSLAGTLQLDYR